MILAVALSAALLFNGPAHPLLSTSLALDAPGDPASAQPPSLDFDLLGDQGKEQVDPKALEVQKEMQKRRFMLTAHQTAGFALAGLMIGTMITGQLNYADKFGGPNTGRFELVHTVFATSTEIVFAGTGALALFAPVPVAPPKDSAWSRADVHRFGMLGATVGMVAEAGLGLWTASREGYSDQSNIAGVHLAIGYTTLACMIVAVSALVF